MQDKDVYKLIADEVNAKNVDAALWAQSKELALGDLDKTEAIYIRLRFAEIIKASPQQQSNTSLAIVKQAVVKVDEVLRVRSELTKKLLEMKKHSLYSVLGLRPDATDDMVAAAIQELQDGELDNSRVSVAEFKYVKEALGHADARVQYDRQLLESFSKNSMQIFHPTEPVGMVGDEAWWNSGKMSVVIATLSIAILGYVGIQYMKEKNASDLLKASVEEQAKIMQTISESERARTQAHSDERYEEQRQIALRQNQEMEMRNRTAERMNDERRQQLEEQQQQAEERKLQYEKQRQEQAEREAARKEENRIASEKRYYACMNVQLSRGRTSYDADAACGFNR